MKSGGDDMLMVFTMVGMGLCLYMFVLALKGVKTIGSPIALCGLGSGGGKRLLCGECVRSPRANLSSVL